MASAVTAACGITLSTIALQVHYGIDVLAGLAWVFPDGGGGQGHAA